MKYNIHTLEISKEAILSRTSELSLWKYYCPNFVENQRFYSEFYPDSNPGCVVYFNNGKGLYYDFGEPEHSYDIFSYIQRKYNINFRKALEIINTDFNLKLGWSQGNSKSLGYSGIPSLIQAKDTVKKQIKVKVRNWELKDKEYWKDKYNISASLLNKYNIYPLSHYWIIKENKEIFITCKSITYGYYFGKDTWKIYSPYSEYKWVSNTTKDVIQGYNQLTSGNSLVITSSLKDVLCWSNLGFNAIAPQSEAQVLNSTVLSLLQAQYKRIFINMDSDEAGREYALKWLKMNPGLINIEVPDFKDLSDYIENYGFEKAQQLVKNLIQ